MARPLTARIVAKLKEHPDCWMTSQQLSKYLNLTTGQTGYYLRILLAEGIVEYNVIHGKPGQWRLAPEQK